jgi:signal transduction histidine kinase
MRKTGSLQQRLNDLPLARKLGLVIAVLSLTMCALLAIAYTGMDTLSSVRAYIGGESLWSKAQKQAIADLYRYAEKRDEAEYQKFLAHLQIPLGDKIARLELDRPQPDLAVVYQGFVQGGNHPDDVRGLIEVYRRFKNLRHMREAIKVWREGDRLIERLMVVGATMNERIASGNATQAELNAMLEEVTALDEQLTPLENAFSAVLGEGARWLRQTLLIVTLGATLLFLCIGLTLAFMISRQLTSQIDRLRVAAVRAAKGDFHQTIPAEGSDEIGDLSRAFQEMMVQREEAEKENVNLTEQLERRVLDLRSANEELESFSYSVSHDLRAPLRAIDGFSAILTDEHSATLDPEGRRLLGTVRRNVGQMSRLIEGLLTFSRLSYRPLAISSVDLMELIKEIDADVRAAEPGRQIQMTIEPLGWLEGDPLLLRQVFVNLLSNAVKFTRNRPVAVIHVRRVDQDDRAVFSVRDNGAGFDMEYADKLFGVFQRLHRPDEFEGTGVGLAIAQRIVHRHGGTMWAESEPDKGACFYVALPFTPPAARNV